jgi:hypothetical protein
LNVTSRGGGVVAVITGRRMGSCDRLRRRLRRGGRRCRGSEIAADMPLGHRGISLEPPARGGMLKRDRSPQTALLDDMRELMGKQSAPGPGVETSFRGGDEDLTSPCHSASVLRRSEQFGLSVTAYLDIRHIRAVQPSDGCRHGAGRRLLRRMFDAATGRSVETRLISGIRGQRRLETERAWSGDPTVAADDGVLQPGLRSRERRSVPA